MPKIYCSSIDSANWLVRASLPKEDGYVHVYRLQLSTNAGAVPNAAILLSSAETERGDKYYHQKDKNRFILSRAALRLLLPAYIGTPAADITFTIGPNKKPYVEGTGIHYNISHAGDWALIAISDKPVGIDVELIDKAYGYQSVLDMCFSAEEIDSIYGAPDPLGAFYLLWTRKEALVKATAKGMDENFKYIPSMDGDHAANADKTGSEADWRVISLPLADQHLVSLAFNPGIQNVSFFEVSDLFKDPASGVTSPLSGSR